MPDDAVRYPRYRFPPAIISHAVWLYYHFALSFRDVEDVLAQRGITVSYETIRHSCVLARRRLRRCLRGVWSPLGCGSFRRRARNRPADSRCSWT
jgi:transposase-like protein